MTAWLPETKCALCGAHIDLKKPFFRATGAFMPAGDALEPYANAALHWACYSEWPERARFARHHVDAWVKANRRNPFWWCVYLDDRIYVSVNPEAPVEEASVRLFVVGSDIRVPLSKWRQWLEDPNSVSPDLQPIERDALRTILPTLRNRFPDDHALVDAIDPQEKRARSERARVG
jgi:hypothetical protein